MRASYSISRGARSARRSRPSRSRGSSRGGSARSSRASRFRPPRWAVPKRWSRRPRSVPLARPRPARGSPCACSARAPPLSYVARRPSRPSAAVFGRGPGVEGGGAVAVGGDGGQLAVVEVDDLLGVAHERGDVGGDEHLALADAEDDRAAVAGHHEPVGLAGVDHGQAVGALDRAQRLAHGVLERRRRPSGRSGGRAPRCRSRRRTRRPRPRAGPAARRRSR